MQAMRFVPTKKLDRREVYANALVALALGALLGVLAVMPYDRLLGFSGEACYTLRSVVAVGLLTRLGARRDPVVLSKSAQSLHVALTGNLERLSGVLKIERRTSNTEVLLAPSRG